MYNSKTIFIKIKFSDYVFENYFFNLRFEIYILT